MGAGKEKDIPFIQGEDITFRDGVAQIDPNYQQGICMEGRMSGQH